MAAVTLQQVAKSYAGQLVLDGIDLAIQKGRKVGLIGANGSGKTTLFKLIIGLERPDRGRVVRSKGLSIGYLPQEPDLPADTPLIEAVGAVFRSHRRLESDLERLAARIADVHGRPDEADLLQQYDRLHARFEAAGGYAYRVRLREVLGGLGFGPEDYDRPVAVLSGGEKCRASLARMLLQEAELLLLDEPTNHLDIDAVRWLEKYLAAHQGGAVIISHDRYLLDRVVSGIIEIEHHRVTVYPTDYSGYAEAKRIRRLHAVREYEKQSEWIAHQKETIERTRYRKDSARQARSRRKLLDNMARKGQLRDKPEAEAAGMKIRFERHDRGGERVVRCEKACKGFGGTELIRDLDFEMSRGQKVGIIGPNGVGKTTLLRMLMRQLEPDAGRVRLFENLTVGYYDQEHRDFEPELSVLETVRRVRPEATEAEARTYLALFLFRGDEVFKRVGDLSGGEQSRVLLAGLVWTNPQVLVLDEPTNHLDIPAREALEAALRVYPGSVLAVSHDRYFLDRVVDRLLVLSSRGRHEIVAGNWSAYAEVLQRREEAARAEQARRQEAARAEKTRRQKTGRARRARQHDGTGGEGKGAGGPARGRKKSRSKYAARRLEELETAIIEAESRIEQIETAFADPAFMRDPALLRDPSRLKALHEEYDRLRDDLRALNAKWEEAIDAQGA